MEKRYNLIHQFRLETYVKVNGEMIPISFAGGNKRFNRNGFYVTSDPQVQEALEKDVAYGGQWTLDKNTLYKMSQEPTVLVDEPVPYVSHPVAAEIPDGNITTATFTVPEPANTADPVLDEITNYTLAKNYILEKFPGTQRPEIISADKLRAFAKDKGITFPNWKD